jgi:hypothetical protein
MRKLYFALAATAAFAAGQAVAAEPPEPPLTNPMTLWDSVTPEGVAETVRELGGQQVEVRGTGADKIVSFVDGNLPFNLAVTICDVRPGKCVGLVMLVIMDTGTTKFSLDALNAQGQKNVYVSVVKFEDNKFGIGHALLVDSGVTKKNVAMNIATFASSVREVLKGLSTQVVASNGAQFKPASLGPALRPVFLNPTDTARYVQSIAKPFAESRRRARR